MRVAHKEVRTNVVETALDAARPPWWRLAQFPYKRAWVDVLRDMPGPRWDPDKRGWWIPFNTLGALPFEVSDSLSALHLASGNSMPKGLHKLQKEVACRTTLDRRHLLAWDPGTGKTAAAIASCIAADAREIVVLCPAAAINEWQTQWRQWGSGFPPEIVSYDNKKAVEHWVKRAGGIGALILDESHHLANRKTARYRRVRGLRENLDDDALLLLLSGTPITNQLYTIWTQLDLMEPGAWGGWKKFCDRYMLYRPNDFADSGVEYFGINLETADELAKRLDAVSTRVTDRDVSDAMVPIKLERKEISHSERITEAVQWSLRHNSGPRLIYTHRIETANRIAEATKGVCVTGDKMTPKKRRETIDKAVKARGCIVATVHSVGESINNLDQVPNCLFAELWWSPRVIIQAIKRVHRLTTRKPVGVTFLVAQGTIDEVIVENLQPKIEGIETVMRPGSVTLQKLVDDVDLTNENFRARLREECIGLEDPYA